MHICYARSNEHAHESAGCGTCRPGCRDGSAGHPCAVLDAPCARVTQPTAGRGTAARYAAVGHRGRGDRRLSPTARLLMIASSRVSAVDYYTDVVLPELYERLDTAFPEFGWRRDARGWIATNNEFTHRVLGVRAER